MKTTKRIVAVLMALILTSANIQPTAFAAEPAAGTEPAAEVFPEEADSSQTSSALPEETAAAPEVSSETMPSDSDTEETDTLFPDENPSESEETIPEETVLDETVPEETPVTTEAPVEKTPEEPDSAEEVLPEADAVIDEPEQAGDSEDTVADETVSLENMDTPEEIEETSAPEETPQEVEEETPHPIVITVDDMAYISDVLELALSDITLDALAASVDASSGDFDCDIFRAKVIALNAQENNTLHSFIRDDMRSPAEKLADSLDNNADFQFRVDGWKRANFNITDAAVDSLSNLGITEQDFYETVLLDILNTELNAEETEEMILGAYAGQVIDIMTDLADYLSENYQMEDYLAEYYKIGSLSELMYAMDGMGANVVDQRMLGEFVYDSYPEMADQFSQCSGISDTMSAAGIFFDGVLNASEAVQRIASYKALTDYCGTSMVQTLDLLCASAPASNLPMQSAISKVKQICESKIAFYIYSAASAGEAIGKTAIKGLLSASVDAVFLASPFGLYKVGQEIGRLMANTCFSTDQIVEKYYLMSCYAKFMKHLRTSVSSAESVFQANMTSANAQNYLNTIALYFTGAAKGCDYAKDFADILHNAPAAIFWESYNYNEFVGYTTSIRSSYTLAAQLLLNDVWQEYYRQANEEGYNDYLTAAGTTGLITIPVESVSANLSAVTWKLDSGVHFLTASVSPANATNRIYRFHSENESIVSVTPDGQCTPKGLGTTTVIVLADDGGCSASVEVTISQYYEGFTIDDLTYTKTGEDTVSVECTPSYSFKQMETHTVNATVSDGERTYTVTSVTNGGFRECSKLKSITLPDTITRIGSYAFYSDSNLTDFHMPASLQYIGSRALCNCSDLTVSALPEGLLEIGDYAFRGCKVSSATLPDSLVKIGSYAFSNSFHTLDGGVAKELVIGAGVIEIGEHAFEFCSDLTMVTIKDAYVRIGSNAFSYCENLASVDLGSRTLSLGGYLFTDNTKLETIELSPILSSITYNTFSDCSGLKSITVAPGNPDFKAVDGVLYSKDMKYLHQYPDAKADPTFQVPDNVLYIQPQAFADNTYLTEITLPDNLLTIGTEAFSRNISLRSIVLPDSVTHIGFNVFQYCTALESAVLSGSMESTEDGTFRYCSALRSVTLPDSIIQIGTDAFKKCAFRTIDLPDGLIYINGSSFYGNTDLAEITIPDSVTAIGPSAFMDCSSLKTVHLPAALSNLGKQAFLRADITGKLVIPEGITTIDSSTFSSNKHLTSVVVPTSVTTIGSLAFNSCDSLTSLTLTGSHPYIYSDAFYYVPDLTVYYPALDSSYDYELTAGNRYKARNLTWAIDPASRISVSKCTIKLSPGTLTYTGKAQLPTVTVTYGGNTVGTANYSVTGTDNKKPGIATITIKGKEALKGSVRKTVKIRPAKPAISKTANAATGVTINWGKVAYATGYVVYRNNKKVKTLTGGSTVSYTDTGARTNGSAYTYKIRAYVKASDGSTIYSAYSPEVKTIYLSRPTARLVNNSAGKLTVSWGKNAKATGYQVKYTVGKTTKTVKITKASAVNKVLSVRKGSTCKVYVRSYKTSGGKNYYSAWSAVKTIKITK